MKRFAFINNQTYINKKIEAMYFDTIILTEASKTILLVYVSPFYVFNLFFIRAKIPRLRGFNSWFVLVVTKYLRKLLH